MEVILLVYGDKREEVLIVSPYMANEAIALVVVSVSEAGHRYSYLCTHIVTFGVPLSKSGRDSKQFNRGEANQGLVFVVQAATPTGHKTGPNHPRIRVTNCPISSHMAELTGRLSKHDPSWERIRELHQKRFGHA